MSDADQMARELTALMDEVEADNYSGSSIDGDPRMVRIEHLANLLSWFHPNKLDKRFNQEER